MVNVFMKYRNIFKVFFDFFVSCFLEIILCFFGVSDENLVFFYNLKYFCLFDYF